MDAVSIHAGGIKTVRMLSQIVATGLVNYPKGLQILVDITIESPVGHRAYLLRSQS